MKATASPKSKPQPQSCGDANCNHDHPRGGLEVGIRLYKPEDYRELKEVWKLGEISCDDTDSARSLKENAEKRKHSYRIFVAEAKTLDAAGRPTGKPRVVAGVICTFDGKRVCIYHFAVHPEFRGLGLATALLETCEHQAKLWGARHMRLMSRTDASRDAARRLYLKNGWEASKNLCQFSKTIDVT